MKKFKLLVAITLFSGSLTAQELETKLDEAQVAYNDGNHEDARFALEQSLVELDKIIGQEILKVLPVELSGIVASVEEDNVTGGMGYSGLFVDRVYAQEPLSINIQVITDSPFLSMVNAALTNPLLASLSGGNQKTIKLSGYKALLEIEEGEDFNSYNFKLPVSSSLISIDTEGFSEKEAIAIANSVDIRSIVALIGSGQ